MTVHALVLQSHDSNVLSYSECKIAKIFWGFAPGSQGGLKAYPPPPPPKIPQQHKIAGYSTVTTLFATNGLLETPKQQILDSYSIS